MSAEHMSEVCAEGLHVQCQGHDSAGGCSCTDPAHNPKQAAADMRAAVRALRANPARAGVAPQHAEILAGFVEVACEDLAGAIPHAEKYDEDPFDVADDPALVRRALRFARSVNATTGGAS